MNGWLDSHKPAASARLHLLFAGLLWALVGAGLLTTGLIWSIRSLGTVGFIVIPVCAGVGAVKSRLVLDGVARSIVARILRRGDGRCLGGFLSLRSWALVAAMIVAGRLLRAWGPTGAVVGPLYVAVGAALLMSSRVAASAWRRLSRDRG